MDRRDLLKLGTLAGTATVATGCTPLLGQVTAGESAMPLSAVKDFLGYLDRTLGVIGSSEGLLGLVPPARGPQTPEDLRGEALLRKSLRSLFVAGSFRDLHEDARTHPEVQERVWNAMPEMDEAVAGTTELFESMTVTERADLNRALRDDPGLAMRVVGAIDKEAAAHGVSTERRVHLRAIAAHTASRMKQSSGMLFDEYTHKVRRLAAQPGSTAEFERRLAARMGQEAFDQMRERTFASAARWQADAPSTPATGGLSVPPPPDLGDDRRSREPAIDYAERRSNKLRAGAIVLGVGVLVGLVGAIAIPFWGSGGLGGSSGGVVGFSAGAFTVGGILLLAGIITLFVGANMRKS
jgi:hypothetical protein